MQPYPYGPYANGAVMPAPYMIPPNYPSRSSSHANQSYNGAPPNYRPPRPSALSYGYPTPPPPPQSVPPGYRPGYMAPGLPPPPMSTLMPIMPSPRSQPQQMQHPYQQSPYQQSPYQPQQQMQHPQGYYGDPAGYYGVNPAIPPGSKQLGTVPKNGAKGSKNNGPKGAADHIENKGIQGLVGGRDVNDLLKQKGTKLKVSKIYHITKNKPNSHLNESSEDEYEQVTLDSPRPITHKQPPLRTARPQMYSVQPSVQARPPPQSARILSAASSCSHCSTCSNCSCSNCRIQPGRHAYDDCPECRAEQERLRRQKQK